MTTRRTQLVAGFALSLLHQGPAGMASTTISGLVYGAVVVMAKGAIWPAALAHGINNPIGLVSLYQGLDG